MSWNIQYYTILTRSELQGGIVDTISIVGTLGYRREETIEMSEMR